MKTNAKDHILKEYEYFKTNHLTAEEFAKITGYSLKEAKTIITAGKQLLKPDSYTYQIDLINKIKENTGLNNRQICDKLGVRADRIAQLLRMEEKLSAKSQKELEDMLPPSEKNTITPTEKKY